MSVATTKKPTVIARKREIASWVWDPDRQRIVWADAQGLAFWGEASLLDLVDREFSGSSKTAEHFSTLFKATEDRPHVMVRMTLTPLSRPHYVHVRAIRTKLGDGRIGLRIDADTNPAKPLAEMDRMRAIVDETPWPITLFTESGQVLMQNAAADQAFGETQKNIVERYSNKAHAAAAVQATLVNEVFSHSTDLITLYGHRRHRVSMRRIADPVTNESTILTFFTDIADRKRVESAASALLSAPQLETGRAASEASVLIEHMPVGVMAFTTVGKLLFANPYARHLLDIENAARPELIRLFPGEETRIIEAIEGLELRQASSRRVELSHVDPATGDERWLVARLKKGVWRGNAALIFSLVDCTEERRTVEGARLDDTLRQDALESLGIGYVFLDAGNALRSISPKAGELLGATPRELEGQQIHTCISPTDEAHLSDALDGLHKEVQLLEISTTGNKPVRLAVGPLSKGRSRRRVLALAPVQQRGMLVKPSEERGLARADSIARASHELRTPLNAIIGFSEMMLHFKERIQDEKFLGYIEDIHASGHYMLQLVEDMVTLRRVEADKLDLTAAPLDLGNLVRRVTRDHKITAEKKGIKVTLALEPELPNIIADVHSLRQAISNLLGNAIKYTNAGGSIRVMASRVRNGAVRIDVTDTGIGMSPGDIEKALEPFGRVVRPTKGYGGAGIGLPLARGFIEANGASFEIQSEKSVGTTVSATFPPDLTIPAQKDRPKA